MHPFINELFRNFAPASNGSTLAGAPLGLPKSAGRKLCSTVTPDGAKIIHLKPLPQISEMEIMDRELIRKAQLQK